MQSYTTAGRVCVLQNCHLLSQAFEGASQSPSWIGLDAYEQQLLCGFELLVELLVESQCWQRRDPFCVCNSFALFRTVTSFARDQASLSHFTLQCF